MKFFYLLFFFTEKNWFESQQQQQQQENAEGENEEEIEIPSVPADPNLSDRCEVCHDKFDQFYNEEKEEWHLKMAIRVEDKTYHPLCYDDYKATLITPDTSFDQSVTEEKKDVEQEEPKTEQKEIVKDEIKEEEVEVKQNENDDSVEEVKIEDPDIEIVTEAVEEIIVDDYEDNEDEMRENEDNKELEIDFTKVKIKQEPLDEDEAKILDEMKNEPIDAGKVIFL